MIPPTDPRELAFEALAPLAPTITEALERVQNRVVEDDRLNGGARAGWTRPQRASTKGYGRFCWTIEELELGLGPLDKVTFISTPAQEAQNLFLWQIAPKLTLRVKSEPSEITRNLTAQLYEQKPAESDQTACLTWQTRADLRIDNISFVHTHGDPWSISLLELQRADQKPNVAPVRPVRPRVQSGRVKKVQPKATDADTPGEQS